MMSSIINKTFNLAVASLTSKDEEPSNLHSLIQALSSFQKKSSIVCKFLEHIKSTFASASLSQQRRHLIVISYCTQLDWNDNLIRQSLLNLGGIVTTFIEQASSFRDKKLGYLTLTTLVACGSNETVYLSVNTILKDLSNKHPELIKISLDVASQLVTVDLVPVLLPVVEKRLQHSDYSVRKKSIVCLHCFFHIAPEFMQNLKRYVKLTLSDKSPHVMASALPFIYEIVKSDATKYEDLSSRLVHILRQVVEGKMPIEMSHHGIAAPFVQIHVLKILYFTKLDKETKAALGNVLLDMMNRCQSSKRNIAFAILSECIEMSVSLFKEDDVMFSTAVQYLGKFFNSSSANFLLVGLELLLKVANVKLSCCAQYQNVVLKCIHHPDVTIKKQTLILMQALVTKQNHKVLCDHMVSQLKDFSNDFFVRSFSEKIAAIVEKFSTDLMWLLPTLHSIIETSRENASASVCNKLFQSVGRATSDELLSEIEHCKKLLIEDVSFYHFDVIAMIIGAYSKKCDQNINDILNLLVEQSDMQLRKQESNKEEVACVLITVAKQLICRKFLNDPDDEIIKKISCLTSPYVQQSPVIYQNLLELDILLKNKEILGIVTEAMEDFEFDGDLSFLDAYNEDEKADEEASEEVPPIVESKLQSQPYTKHAQPMIKSSSGFMASMLPQPTVTTVGESFLSKKVSGKHPSVWDKSGYKPTQTSLSLNQALQNLSSVDDTAEEDKAMLDIMNDVLQASLTSSSDTD